MNAEQAALVLTIMASEETSLRRLAEISGLDPFSFYQGADLISLDLKGQDLRGMNFDKADIRFSDLSNASYDPGAFNGSICDNQQEWLVDEFEFYADDVFDFPITAILIFCRFRPSAIEEFFDQRGVSYASFCEQASVSANALRKARRGQVIAHETAVRVLETIRDVYSDKPWHELLPSIGRILQQPVVEFLSGGINMPFIHTSRDRLRRLVAMKEEIVSIRQHLAAGKNFQAWRDTPEFIEQMLSYYRNLRGAAERQ